MRCHGHSRVGSKKLVALLMLGDVGGCWGCWVDTWGGGGGRKGPFWCAVWCFWYTAVGALGGSGELYCVGTV